MLKVYDLQPINQKSFYGKARILDNGKQKTLVSYDTVICSFTNDGIFIPFWIDYSATTMKHINAFMYSIGLNSFNKKKWLSLEYNKEYTINDLYNI